MPRLAGIFSVVPRSSHRVLLSTATLCALPLPLAAATLEESLDAIAPDIKKWAVVCLVTERADGSPEFTWHDYRGSAGARDFWPASAIKLYAAVAALELLAERGFPLDTTLTFEHREGAGGWTTDCARTMREMLGEIFRRSSNEDYTLLLRLVGIDRMNTRFLIPEKGFPHSALMRGYVLGRPYGYVREEPQRITLRAGERSEIIEHTWSGRSHAEERGATVIDARTGNVTSPRELAECLRRVLFHERIPDAERYALAPEQLDFLRHGGGGLRGLENKDTESDPLAWKNALDAVFPSARFFHKCGWISTHALEVAYVDDGPQSGKRFFLVPVIAAGDDTRPKRGQVLLSKMARAIGEWVRGGN